MRQAGTEERSHRPEHIHDANMNNSHTPTIAPEDPAVRFVRVESKATNGAKNWNVTMRTCTDEEQRDR